MFIGIKMDKAAIYAQVAQRYTEEAFPELDDLSIDELCRRRLEIHNKLKLMEGEKKAIDEHLLGYLSDAELKKGVKVTNDMLLKSRSRGYWEYPDDVVANISNIREEAQHLGTAVKLTTTYLAFTRA